MSRASRGLKAEKCAQCRTGLAPGQPKLFDPRCAGCLDKKAAGLRTGDEPRPTHRGGEVWVDYTKLHKQRAAQRKQRAAMPSPRGAL